MLPQWLDRSSLLLLVAAASAVFWLVATVVGAHPDGAILGFSGTMWAVWATNEKDTRRRADRAHRVERKEGKPE